MYVIWHGSDVKLDITTGTCTSLPRGGVPHPVVVEVSGRVETQVKFVETRQIQDKGTQSPEMTS